MVVLSVDGRTLLGYDLFSDLHETMSSYIISLCYIKKEAQRAWCGNGAPPRSEKCRIACAGDCVVSSWGAWSPCSAPCVAPGHSRPTRTRRRHILAHAAPSKCRISMRCTSEKLRIACCPRVPCWRHAMCSLFTILSELTKTAINILTNTFIPQRGVRSEITFYIFLGYIFFGKS